MPDIEPFSPRGMFHEGWTAEVNVFQGVHMLFTAQPDKEWGNEPRRNQLVFIGRNLNEKEMLEDFDKCLI